MRRIRWLIADLDSCSVSLRVNENDTSSAWPLRVSSFRVLYFLITLFISSLM